MKAAKDLNMEIDLNDEEFKALQQQRDQLAVSVDGCQLRVAELENALSVKEKACVELKTSLEYMRQCKSEADEAYERRYQV